MEFRITQFTLDPNNYVNVSDFLINRLEKLVNGKICKKVKTEEKYRKWKLIFLISSHSSYAKRGFVSLNPTRSFKFKELEYYVYFPKLSKHQKYNYNRRKFVKFFFEGLKSILGEFDFNDDALLKECLQHSLDHFITDPRSMYKDDNIYLSKKEIARILRPR